MRRSRVRNLIAALFALLAINAWWQAVLHVLHRAEDPPEMILLQSAVGAVATAAAWGAWRDAAWAPPAALLYGLVTAGMLVALAPILDLPSEARPGLWSGAALVLLFAVAIAWYLRRARALDRSEP